jgi:hypothetical protein
VVDFQGAASLFLRNRPAALVTGCRHDAVGGGGSRAELTADQDIISFARREHRHHKEADSDPPAFVDEGDLTVDGDLDFLRDHLKAIDERLKSAQGQHKSSLQEERKRTIDRLKKIADLKRQGQAAAAKKAIDDEMHRLALMHDIRQKICEMGRCPMDFAWRWIGSGFQCEGGSHFASAEDLGVSSDDCAKYFSNTGVVDV